ncbi:hypothetical protein HQ524_01170, partial [Candidatus Uhrbacteria bacterium]|nr:hypothetical protein [Candidatus Uhrbacteria bacterium]
RNGRPAPYGYDWDALRSVVLNFFGSRAWFLETDRDGVIASHSAVAGEMYPDGLRNLHAFLKSNSSVLNDQTLDIDNLLKSTFLWQNGYLTSSVKRGFLHDLLALVEARRITEVMLR